MHLQKEPITFGDRMADRIASFGGSWTFIGIFVGVMLVWITINILEHNKSFDPYPFILLNLVLSCLAALQAPIIMMSQNRQSLKDREQAQHDYDINIRAEKEIAALHAKIDSLIEIQTVQREEITLLKGLLQQRKA
jgi:uncharacterized membrane protein